MQTHRRLIAVLTVVPIAAFSLVGCAAGQPKAAPSSTPTITVTSTPAAVQRKAQANDPLAELDAWNACSSAAQAGYTLQNPGAAVVPYDESRAPVKNGDGSFNVNVGITPAQNAGVNGGIVAICTVRGTLGAPEIVKLSFKDI